MSERAFSPESLAERWLNEREAAAHANMSVTSFRLYVRPKLAPSKPGKRMARYDRLDIDRVMVDAKGGAGAPLGGEEAVWLAKLDEDSGARR